MKKCIYKCFTALMVLSGVYCNLAYAQDGTNDRVESSVAILDTAIPFAIGAREGEQTIRSSFGWPTFQEGFVEGVYFRFDPDGYARFSKSPRLDEDVFEVLCNAGTTKCIAKKNGLEIGLTDQGQPHLNIIGLTVNDHFFISDRKTELPLPQSILGPLEQRLETLLSSGGDLIIRRELETLQTLSLSGFSATVTYLRWVAQNQSSFIFPRGWPVPSQHVGGQTNTRPKLSESFLKTSQSQSDRWGGLNVGRPVSTGQQAVSAPIFKQEISELPSVEFAQQAQGRSLTSDVNKFALSPQAQPYDRNTYDGSSSQQDIPQDIWLELSNIHSVLNSLDVKLNNLIQQINYKDEYVVNKNVGGIKQGRLFDTSNQDQRLYPIEKSDDEKMREAAIKSLLVDVQRESNSTSIIPNTTNQGEVSVKKTIVERLLEELNGPGEPQDTLVEKEVPVSNEFISLSDYINKVMQEETQ